MTATGARRNARVALAVVIVVVAAFGGLHRPSPVSLDRVERGVQLVATSSAVEHATAAVPKPPQPFTSALTIAVGGLFVTTALFAAWPGVLVARGPTAVPATVDARWQRRGPPPR
jgi:hypothetical protein